MNENNFEDLLIERAIEDFQNITKSPEYSLLLSNLQDSFELMSEIMSQIVERFCAFLSDIVSEIVSEIAIYYEFEKLPRPLYKTFDKAFTKAYVMQPVKRGLGYRKKAR